MARSYAFGMRLGSYHPQARCRILGVLLGLLLETPLLLGQSTFVRGDFNADSDIDIGDPVGILIFLFREGIWARSSFTSSTTRLVGTVELDILEGRHRGV